MPVYTAGAYQADIAVIEALRGTCPCSQYLLPLPLKARQRNGYMLGLCGRTSILKYLLLAYPRSIAR